MLNPGIMCLIKILAASPLVDYYEFEKYNHTVEEASQIPQQTNPYFEILYKLLLRKFYPTEPSFIRNVMIIYVSTV